MRPQSLSLLIFAVISLPALAADPAPPADACVLSGKQLEAVSGLKFVKREVLPWTLGQWQCKDTMESGWVAQTRLLPESQGVKTEAEIAAKFAENDKRRLLKDFPVPAYSFTGGVNVVLPNGAVWQVLVMHGEKRGLDPMKIARALVDAKGK